ncbi:MAG: hypothetical protein AB7O26_20980 [Planctomycetaceae bacterium]
MTKKIAALLACCVVAVSTADAAAPGFKQGKAPLKSAGPIAFGPDGVLFISDPKAAAIVAVETQDTKADPAKPSIEVAKVNEKIAAALGTAADQIRIADMAVNPANGKIYFSVSRGLGPDAQPVIVRVDSTGAVSDLSLDDVSHAVAELPNAADDKLVPSRRGKVNNREQSITDLAYLEGQLIVAGLSNEEFASNLRTIRFPFNEVSGGSSIEIYHGNHGALETRSPVRTFVPVSFDGEPQLIAAYTCTPLVRIPVAELNAGKKVRGTTVAELGNRNRPLDIIAYKKDGKNFLLMANDARGVMKISTEELTSRDGIAEKVDEPTAGQPFETLKEWTGVTQLDQLNDAQAVVLIEKDGVADLKTVPLP